MLAVPVDKKLCKINMLNALQIMLPNKLGFVRHQGLVSMQHYRLVYIRRDKLATPQLTYGYSTSKARVFA